MITFKEFLNEARKKPEPGHFHAEATAVAEHLFKMMGGKGHVVVALEYVTGGNQSGRPEYIGDVYCGLHTGKFDELEKQLLFKESKRLLGEFVPQLYVAEAEQGNLAGEYDGDALELEVYSKDKKWREDTLGMERRTYVELKSRRPNRKYNT